MLVDTDVLIWHLRGYQQAAQHLDRLPGLALSVDLMETLALSHGLQIADALIAATAIEHGLTLLSGNVKHFSSVEGLQIEHFKLAP